MKIKSRIFEGGSGGEREYGSG